MLYPFATCSSTPQAAKHSSQQQLSAVIECTYMSKLQDATPTAMKKHTQQQHATKEPISTRPQHSEIINLPCHLAAAHPVLPPH
jgi:hypothetical protein